MHFVSVSDIKSCSGLVAIARNAACPVGRAPTIVRAPCQGDRHIRGAHAKPVEVVINGIPMTVEGKEFSAGSSGWFLNGKANIRIGEKSVSD